VEKVIKKARRRVVMLRALAGRDWGWEKKMMRSTYVALVRSVLMYGAAAWTPWLSETEWGKLEAVQREAARCITGLLCSSPTEAVLIEARLEELREVAEGEWMVEWEKYMRKERGNHRRELVEKEVKQRLKKQGWRRKSSELVGV